MRDELGCGIIVAADRSNLAILALGIQQVLFNTSFPLLERFTVPPSQSNFVLAQWNGTPDARAIFETLRADNILVRYFNARRLQDALRITIGTDEETDAFLNALRGILG